MSLLDLQRDFRSALLHQSDDIRRRLDGKADAGLGVYRNAYRARLRECLRETYERTWAWLGDARFDALAQRYVCANPSESWTLGDYGGRFARLLSVEAPDAPEASELAALEWALRTAFDGRSAPTLNANDCEAIDWDGAVLRFTPTLSLLTVATNCGAIWAAISEGRTPPDAQLLPAPAALLVWRKNLSPQFRTIDGQELLALRLCLSGVSFGEVCRLAARHRSDVDVVTELGCLLARWLCDELLVAAAADETGDAPDKDGPEAAINQI